MLTSRSPKVKPSTCQCRVVREDIEQVRTNSSRADNFRKHHHRPSSTETDEREFLLQSLAVEDHSCNTERTWDVSTPETVLGTVFSAVRFDIAVCKEVVEEVPEEFAHYAADYGCKVEEGGVGVVQEVGWWADELGDGRYDANCPGEKHEDEKT